MPFFFRAATSFGGAAADPDAKALGFFAKKPHPQPLRARAPVKRDPE